MSDPNQQIVELVRKVDSEFHDPNLHGQGVVVSWNRKKKQWASNQGALSKALSRKNVDYYFVKTNSKPIYIKKLSFEWCEGTSDVSLAFEANFQIRIRDQQDAEKLVELLIQIPAISVDNAFYQLIDEKLHRSMERLYVQCNSARKNLLDEFYLAGSPKGENFDLDSEVSQAVNSSLQRLDFRIGFTLYDAPERVADFSHCTQLKKSPSQKEFNVESECVLKLSNYQMYKRSGIQNLEEVIAYMKKVIDQAINEFVSGKSLFDLFSNFGSSSESNKKSILELVRKQVEDEAETIGYELQSFYSLPDVAPLKLLNGIRIDIGEDESFSTAYGGGNIKINAGLEVKAIDGSFDSLLHLLSPSGNSQDMDVLEFTHSDLVKSIRKPIVLICKNVIIQKDYKTACLEFDEKVKNDIESELLKEMAEQYGLQVEVKTMFPIETEDSSRFQELSAKRRTFNFRVTSESASNGDVNFDFSSAYKIVGIDLEAGWESFEKTDFGYRENSPERMHFEELDEASVEYDRLCKTKAIQVELDDIADEIIQFFKLNLKPLPDLRVWYDNPRANQEYQEELINQVSRVINVNRGLVVKIENIYLDEKRLSQTADDEIKREIEHQKAVQLKLGELDLIQIEEEANLKLDYLKKIKQQMDVEVASAEDLELLTQKYKEVSESLKKPIFTQRTNRNALDGPKHIQQETSYEDTFKALKNKGKHLLEKTTDEGEK